MGCDGLNDSITCVVPSLMFPRMPGPRPYPRSEAPPHPVDPGTEPPLETSRCVFPCCLSSGLSAAYRGSLQHDVTPSWTAPDFPRFLPAARRPSFLLLDQSFVATVGG